MASLFSPPDKIKQYSGCAHHDLSPPLLRFLLPLTHVQGCLNRNTQWLSTRGDFAPRQGTFGNIWGQFCLSQLRVGVLLGARV